MERAKLVKEGLRARRCWRACQGDGQQVAVAIKDAIFKVAQHGHHKQHQEARKAKVYNAMAKDRLTTNDSYTVHI